MRAAALLTLLLLAARAEAPAKPDIVIGVVASVDRAARRLTLRTDAGSTIAIVLAEGAAPLRTKPGATTLEGAATIALEDVATGDRVMARGTLSAEKDRLDARQLVVMSQQDLSAKREQEQADWKRRGALGVVTAVSATDGTISLRVGRSTDAPPLVVRTAGREVSFRHYVPGSVRFADAKPSSIGEVRLGDELRVKGDRDEAGAVVAEQVVFGTFTIVSGTVSAVGSDSVTLQADDTPRKLTVAVGPDARLRRLPPEMAAWQGRSRESGPATREGTAGNREPAAGGREWSGGRRNPEDLLQRMPETTLAELKSGDRILVSSTKGSDPNHLDAIVLVSGLPPASAATGGPRRGRARESDVPPELMDLGLSVP
jgi:hypothetical protein